jgi:nicotinate-nucleotide--dimethylbenzimidazole phosphoribosyltransferase
MKRFRIHTPEENIKERLQDKIDNLSKPRGSLGRLEELALQAGLIQQTLSPVLTAPCNVIFAADHGITAERVSVSPPEVTRQQCLHFLKGGGGINVFCRRHGFRLLVVDAGVDGDFPPGCGIIDRKVRKGTRNCVHEAAMTGEEMEWCIDRGAAVVRDVHRAGCNVISFGEMGIGNTSPSSLWMTCLTNIPLSACVGAGAGLSAEGVRHKYRVLRQALDNYPGNRSAPEEVMRRFGGYEMVMAVGAMLQAAELKMIILTDGFIMTNCLLAASRLYPAILSYAVFGHCSDEAGHRLLLDALHARPLIDLGMRLGEGTGAVCAYPVLDAAVCMINEMDSFDEGKVTKYF